MMTAAGGRGQGNKGRNDESAPPRKEAGRPAPPATIVCCWKVSAACGVRAPVATFIDSRLLISLPHARGLHQLLVQQRQLLMASLCWVEAFPRPRCQPGRAGGGCAPGPSVLRAVCGAPRDECGRSEGHLKLAFGISPPPLPHLSSRPLLRAGWEGGEHGRCEGVSSR